MYRPKYYKCSVCSHNSPSNIVIKENGIETGYCLMHYRRMVLDDKKSQSAVKKADEWKDNFRKAFVNASDRVSS